MESALYAADAKANYWQNKADEDDGLVPGYKIHNKIPAEMSQRILKAQEKTQSIRAKLYGMYARGVPGPYNKSYYTGWHDTWEVIDRRRAEYQRDISDLTAELSDAQTEERMLISEAQQWILSAK
jgi:hypothetical protein